MKTKAGAQEASHTDMHPLLQVLLAASGGIFSEIIKSDPEVIAQTQKPILAQGKE